MKAAHFSRLFRVGILLLVVLIVVAGTIDSVSISQAQDGGQRHTVQSGENLFRIALRYGITVDELAVANGITDPTRIYAGQVLIIPGAITTDTDLQAIPNQSDSAPAEAQPIEVAATTSTYHLVSQGETLYSISVRYGVNWQDLAAWNSIGNPNQLYAGQRLIINNPTSGTTGAIPGPTIVEAQPIENAPAAASSQTYIVQPGDRLASIARQFNISWTTIASANNITNPNTIYVGQQLVIPSADIATGTYFEPNGGVPAAAAPTITTGKQIVVNLTEQRVYAYENGALVRTSIVSTGMWGTPTVTGDYRIYWKLTSQTMSGPGYYLPGVPWVMYFYQGYALHGTYWHNNFGQPMSHGCVNLPTDEAEWLFRWAEVGTPVNVRY